MTEVMDETDLQEETEALKHRMTVAQEDTLLQMFSRLDQAKKQEAEAKLRHANCKKATDSLNAEIADYVKEIKSGQMNLFDQGDDTDTLAVDADDEAWRQVELSTLNIRPAILEKLSDNEPPILTMGDLADWQQAKGDFWAKDIHGIGPEAESEIADACMDYHVQVKAEREEKEAKEEMLLADAQS